MKKFLIILAIVVVVLVATVAVLVANLDKVVNSRKDYILEKAEAAVGREITVGDVGVTLSRGIGVKLSDVALAEDPAINDGDFVTAKDLTIRVKALPLLKKQVKVKRLVLNEPVVHIIRGQDGAYNFATIGKGRAENEGGAATTEQAVEPGGEAATPGALASLALAYADIENGTIRFEDRRDDLEFEVKRVDVKVENASLGEVASVKFAAAVFGEDQDLKLEGEVGPVESVDTPADLSPTPVRLTVSVGPLDAAKLRNVFPDDPKLERLETLAAGPVRGSLNINGTVGALRLEESEFTAAVLGAQSPNLTLKAQAGPVDLTASSGDAPPKVTFSGDLELRPVSLVGLQQAFGTTDEVPPELELDGAAEVAVRFDGSPNAVSVVAGVDLKDGSIKFADKFQKPAGVPANVECAVDFTSAAAKIERCKCTMGPLVLNADGRVDFAGGAPSVDVSMRSEPSDVARLADLLPVLKTVSAGGTLKLLASIKGAMAQGAFPEVRGEIQLHDGTASIEQLPEPVTKANATVTFTEKSANVQTATLQVGRSEVRVNGRATSFQPLKADYKVTSDEVYRADFQVPPDAVPRPEVLRDVTVEGQISQEGDEVRLEGKATSRSGTVANLDYTDLTASLQSVEDRIDLPSFSAKTLGGTVEGSGSYLPKENPPRFEVSTRVRQVNLVEYFRYKVKSIPKFIEGSLDCDLDLSGAGKDWQQIEPTLTGEGGAVVVKGSLLNVNIANELFLGLEQLPLLDRNALDSVRRKNPKLFSSDHTVFEDLRAKVRIDDGKIHSNGMVLKTSEYSIYGDGWISFDRQLGIRSNLVFTPSATRNIIDQLPVAKYLTDDKGRLELPLVLSGQLVRPTIAPDIDVLTKKLKSAGVDQLRDQVEDQVKDFLKGFGKKSSSKPDTSKGP